MSKMNRYGKNSWKIGMMNFIISLVAIVLVAGVVAGAFFFIKPRYEAYQEAKILEQKEEEKRLAKEEAEAKAEAEKQAKVEKRRLAEEEKARKAEAAKEPTSTPTPEPNNDYVIADSDKRYLSDADVRNMSIQQVNYAKNEIYARRGRKFASNELRNYFNSKSWYNGTIEPGAFSDSVFNDYEIKNAAFLSKVEMSMNPNGYQLDS